MGTASSIATGLLNGYTRGLQINAFRDQERQRSEAGELDLARGRDEKAERESVRQAEAELANMNSTVDAQMAGELPPGQPVSTPFSGQETAPAEQPGLEQEQQAAPQTEAAPQEPPAQSKRTYNPMAPLAGIPQENRRAYMDRKYELKGQILENYYNKIRQPEKALAVRGVMSKLRDSEIEEKGRGALLAMATGDPNGVAAFAKVYQLYDDGRMVDPKSGTFDQATQTWKGIRLLDAETGKEVGTRDVTQSQLFALASNLSAADIAKNNIERMQKIEDEKRARISKLSEPFTVKPGEKRMVFDPVTGKQHVMGEGNIQPGYDISGYDAEGNPILVKNSSSGGTSSGGSKKGPPTELEIGDGVLDDALKGKNSDINPSQHVQVKDTYRRLMTENPTMPGQMGARVALAITVDPTLVKPDIDPMTGRISNVYKDPATDEEIVIRPGVGSATRIPQDAEGKPVLSADAMRVGAQKTLQFISDKFGQNVAKLYQKAAFDNTGKGRTELNNALRPIMEQEAAKEPRWASLPADAKATVIQRMLDANQDQINLIRNFGTPPAGDGAANRLKAGVGIGIPDRVRADIEKEAAASRAKREADAKAKQQKNAERDKLKGEIRGLNDEMIMRMTPNEAEAFEQRYRAALTMDQRTKLIDRSMDKIPGIGDRTPMGF